MSDHTPTLAGVAASTNTTGRLPESKGLLRPEEFARRICFGEVRPSGPASSWVERVWSTAWDLPPGLTQTTSLIPHPAIDLTVERGGLTRAGVRGDGSWLTGVVTKRFDVTLTGAGGAVGIKFRPGGFTAWSGLAADRLTDRVLPADSLIEGAESLRGLPPVAEEAAPVLLGFVEDRAGAAEPVPAQLQRALDLVLQPVVTRVDDLAERCGCSVRTLQRIVRHYVGVAPKWLIRRQRMHDAVAALDARTDESLAELAVRLGWYDQSQFARDFARLVGISPSAYRDRSGSPAAAELGSQRKP